MHKHRFLCTFDRRPATALPDLAARSPVSTLLVRCRAPAPVGSRCMPYTLRRAAPAPPCHEAHHGALISMPCPGGCKSMASMALAGFEGSHTSDSQARGYSRTGDVVCAWQTVTHNSYREGTNTLYDEKVKERMVRTAGDATLCRERPVLLGTSSDSSFTCGN